MLDCSVNATILSDSTHCRAASTFQVAHLFGRTTVVCDGGEAGKRKGHDLYDLYDLHDHQLRPTIKLCCLLAEMRQQLDNFAKPTQCLRVMTIRCHLTLVIFLAFA